MTMRTSLRMLHSLLTRGRLHGSHARARATMARVRGARSAATLFAICFSTTVLAQDDGCTFPQGYWKTHFDGNPRQAQNIPWPVPIEDRFTCGRPWFDILTTPSNGDAWHILARQFVAASLNAANGASVTALDGALDDVRELLVTSCSGISSADKATALTLAGILDDFNNGVIGPGACEALLQP